MMRALRFLAVLVLLGALPSGPALAASLEISPVLVNFAPGQRSATIEVSNRGGIPATIQARPFTWAQAGDQDVLSPTNEIILSPPVFTVPAGASQTVRLLLRGGAQGGERDYRLLLDEVPAAISQGKQIVIALRLSLPVIARSAASGPPTLQWRAEHSGDGQIVLTATNTGGAYAVVSAIEVTRLDGSRLTIVRRGKNPYVLPGAQRKWVVQRGSAVLDAPLRLNVTTQAGRTEQILEP